MVESRHVNFVELISQAFELERIELEGMTEKGIREKEKSGKPDGQSSGNSLGKRKDFGGPRAHRYGKGRSLG